MLVCPALKAQVDLTPGQKAAGLRRRQRRRAPIPVPLDAGDVHGNPERLEFIRRDPLSLREVTASFFFQQALWDRKLRAATGLDLPLLLLQAGDDPIVDREWVHGWFDAPALARTSATCSTPSPAHILDFEPDPQPYLDDLASWLDERVGRAAAAPPCRWRAIEVLTADLPFRILVRPRARLAQRDDERPRPAHALRRHASATARACRAST